VNQYLPLISPPAWMTGKAVIYALAGGCVAAAVALAWMLARMVREARAGRKRDAETALLAPARRGARQPSPGRHASRAPWERQRSR
jgi:hypothetical protein